MTFKDALKKWFYSNGTTAGTTTSRIPLLDASGNAIGSDTVPEIAALFGGLLTYESKDITTGDLNDYMSAGGYKIIPASSGSVLNVPFTGPLYMMVMGSGTTAVQICVATSNRMAVRAKAYGTNWADWYELPKTLPTESSEEFIVQKRATNITADIDTLKTANMRYCATGADAMSSYSGTFPSGVATIGFELVVSKEGYRTVQYYYENGVANRYFKRVLNNTEDTWGGWYVYTGTVVS